MINLLEILMSLLVVALLVVLLFAMRKNRVRKDEQVLSPSGTETAGADRESADADAIKKRHRALAFWALFTGAAFAFGPSPFFVYPLLAALLFEVLAYIRVRQIGAAAQTRALSLASQLSIFAAILLLLPDLIDHALGDSVYSCWGDNCEPEEGTNLVGWFVWMALFALVAAWAALLHWIQYMAQMVRLSRAGSPG